MKDASQSAAYARDAEECLAACKRWKAENPDARLKFNAITAQKRVAIACDLGDAVKHLGVAGNSITRKLLLYMHRATTRGATVLMADAAIEMTYGIPRALSEKRE